MFERSTRALVGASTTRLATALIALAISARGNTLLGEDAEEFPATYQVEFASAERFCPPLRSTFFEVEQNYMVVRGKRFRQKKNGGYGLRVVDKVGGQNLLHVGADLGWYQIGEPVFAVAAGVVRLSTGPDFDAAKDPKDRRKAQAKRPSAPSPTQLAWGNVVAIEHRLPEGTFTTTIYGHLDSKRLVKAGDVVEAGQPLAPLAGSMSKSTATTDPTCILE